MNCLDSQDLLQRRLDGDSSVDSQDLTRHLSICSLCRERHASAVRLIDGLKSLSRPKSAAGLKHRIVAKVMEDRRLRERRVRIRFVITSALAASLLLLALTGYFILPGSKTQTPNPEPIVLKDKDTQQKPVPDIAKSMDDARHAMASMTERLAGETKEKTKMLLAAASPLDVGAPVILPSLPDAGDAAEPLRHAGQGFSESLEPVTRTTRRALRFFAREVASFDAGEK